MSGRLEGKIAIVTGAGCVGPGWGNGRATTVRFAEEGAAVLAVDRERANLVETLARARESGGRVEAFVADLSAPGAASEMIDACIRNWGRVDVLVNNIGGSAAGGPVEMTPETWASQLDVNLTTVFRTLKEVLPVMERQGGGAIVNIGSTSGLRWTGAPQVAYAASKAGLLQMSRVVAVQYASKSIRVNTVVPGQLHTPMVESRLARQRAGGDVQALLRQRQARIPLGFMGDGRDTANAVLFLASDEARFVTGAELVVDGGMTVRCD